MMERRFICEIVYYIKIKNSCNVKTYIILIYKVIIINKQIVRYECHVSSFYSFNVCSLLAAVSCDLARIDFDPAVDAYIMRKLKK